MASIPPATGPTAFVLAGGGTKGSFEVGVLQYLVGVEGIVPDVITATSAGAIAATVLSQARGRDEFADRVAELERDVLAWTRSDHVFGKQPWLGALDGTRLGREIHQELTEGTRPPFPLTPEHRAGGGTRPCRRAIRTGASVARPARPAASANATSCACSPGRASASRGCGASCARAGARCSTLTRLPTRCATAARKASGPSTPRSSPRPGLRLRLAVTALRAGVLRFVTEDGTIVEADARTPAPDGAGRPRRPGRRGDRLGQCADGLPAPPHGGRRLRRRRCGRDRARSGPPPRSAPPASSPWWRCP